MLTGYKWDDLQNRNLSESASLTSPLLFICIGRKRKNGLMVTEGSPGAALKTTKEGWLGAKDWLIHKITTKTKWQSQ